MARETKAEREARVAAERAAKMERNQAEYPARLMEAFERVSNQQLELSVREGLFAVSDPGDRYNTEYLLSYSWSTNAQNVLEDLEWALTNLEEKQAEEKRREEVRVNAQKKVQELFTAEERELLGL